MKTKTKAALGVSAILLAGVVTAVGIGSSGFHNWKIPEWFNRWGKGEQVEQVMTSSGGTGGMVISNGENRGGVDLAGAVLPRSAYAANGVSARTEEAYKITATIDPSYANAPLIWSIDYANSSAQWATENALSDCVSMTGVNGEKAVVLQCLKAFGEQIVVTATVEDQPDIFATCNLDYAQRVSLISFSFGDVVCNLSDEGEETDVIVEIGRNPMGVVPGGAANLELSLSTVYTIAEEYTVDYALSSNYEIFKKVEHYAVASTKSYYFGTYPDGTYSDTATFENLDQTALTNYSVAEEGLYFGIEYFAENLGLHSKYMYAGQFSESDILLSSNSVPYMIECFEKRGQSFTFDHTVSSEIDCDYSDEYNLFDLTLTINGKYFTMQKSTTFTMSGYTNTTPVSDIEFDITHIVF